MPRRCVIARPGWSALTLLLALAPDAATAAAPYAAPSPSFLHEIRARHGKNDWWYITTDSARLLVRIRRIDEAGLSGLRPKHKQDVVPDALGWSSIARIDERHSKFLSKRITWVILGGVAGSLLPFALTTDHQEDGGASALGAVVGAGLGGWLGGKYGASIERVEPVYLSTTLVSPVPAAPASAPPTDSLDAEQPDSSRAAAAAGVPSGAATSSPTSPQGGPIAAGGTHSTPAAGTAPVASSPADTLGIAAACREIRPGSRILLAADFGTFDGSVESATPEGLRGLRLNSQQAKVEPMPGLVTWDRIRRVDRHATMARAGARRGAWILGSVGLLVGVAANAVSSASGGQDGGGSWLLLGAAAGAAGGALIGAAIGSTGTSWVNVYER